jgi:hypothetical protein
LRKGESPKQDKLPPLVHKTLRQKRDLENKKKFLSKSVLENKKKKHELYGDLHYGAPMKLQEKIREAFDLMTRNP